MSKGIVQELRSEDRIVCSRSSESGHVNCMSASRGGSKPESRVDDAWLRAVRVAPPGDTDEASLLMSMLERSIVFGGLLPVPMATEFCGGVRAFCG